MAFDEDCRLFVIEMRDYSEDDKANLGRIRVLEDTDEDGRFDKSTVLVDGQPVSSCTYLAAEAQGHEHFNQCQAALPAARALPRRCRRPPQRRRSPCRQRARRAASWG